MMSLIVLILGLLIVAVLVGGIIWAARKDSVENKKTLIEAQAEEKEKNKQKILEMLNSKERITNKEVEQGLKVSDATATRYLDELEKAGIIKQVGTDGPFVYYSAQR